jgi:hypothetical protein
LLSVALGLVERWYRSRAGRTDGRGGSVTAIQRFGSALNLNLHFHVGARSLRADRPFEVREI